MDNVVTLTGARVNVERTVNEGVVTVLREVMQKAEAGEIVGIAGVVYLASEGIGYIAVGEMNALTMAGAMDAVKMRLIDECYEDGE